MNSAGLHTRDLRGQARYLGVGVLEGGLVQEAVDVPPLQDLLLFFGPPELHVDFNSPAAELLVRVTCTFRSESSCITLSIVIILLHVMAHVGVSPFILELGEPISTVAGSRHLGHFRIDFAVDNFLK